MKTDIAISEVFGPTIQGEGALIGRPTVFVRTGGCDFACSWCDTLYAVLPEFRGDWTGQSAAQILDKVLSLSGGRPILITLSGGNPALQPLEPLLDLGHEYGCSFALETQSTVARAWFAKLDHLVLSPKPPSSQMLWRPSRLTACVEAAQQSAKPPSMSLKIVIFDQVDYQFARAVHAQFPALPVYLQPGNPAPAQPGNDWQGAPDVATTRDGIQCLLEWTARDGWFDATILPQLHVLLWGNTRGV